MKTLRKDGIYRHRFMWWFPWGVTRWWLPRILKGGDEWCNDSVIVVIPPLGALVVFWRPGRLDHERQPRAGLAHGSYR